MLDVHRASIFQFSAIASDRLGDKRGQSKPSKSMAILPLTSAIRKWTAHKLKKKAIRIEFSIKRCSYERSKRRTVQ